MTIIEIVITCTIGLIIGAVFGVLDLVGYACVAYVCYAVARAILTDVIHMYNRTNRGLRTVARITKY